MKTRVIDNLSCNMATILKPAIETADDVRVAVAFASQGGVALLESSLRHAIGSGAYLEFLVGLDMQITEPEALYTLNALALENENFSLYCYVTKTTMAMYHPKLYITRSGSNATSAIGSSNLTTGGLTRNLEVNVVIEGLTSEEPISESYDSYNRLKFSIGRILPNEELLSIYEKLYEHNKKHKIQASEDDIARDMQIEYKKKILTLELPTRTRRDLLGWLELVYDALPDGQFTTKDAYQEEALFQMRYPSNHNIRAKVRQQLQLLRDMGFLAHDDTGYWRKL